LLRSLKRGIGGFRINIRVLEEPELEFEAKHAPDCRVNDFEWHAPGLNFGLQWLSVRE
jgi:hypothetical protein